MDWIKVPKSLQVECGHRIKGVLFFDNHFEPNRNKLKLDKVDLADVLNRCRQEGGQRSHKLETRFGDWLKRCHSELDRNIVFSDEIESKDSTGTGDGTGTGTEKGDSAERETRYRKLAYDGWRCETGDRVRFTTKAQRGSERTSQWGVVKYFLKSARNLGWVVYKFEPLKSFVNENRHVLKRGIQGLDRVTDRKTLNEMYAEHELNEMAGVPQVMRMWFKSAELHTRLLKKQRAAAAASGSGGGSEADELAAVAITPATDMEWTKSDTPKDAEVVSCGYHIAPVEVSVYGHPTADGERIALNKTRVVWELVALDPDQDGGSGGSGGGDSEAVPISAHQGLTGANKPVWFGEFLFRKPGLYRLLLDADQYDAIELRKHWRVTTDVPASLKLDVSDGSGGGTHKSGGGEIPKWQLSKKHSTRIVMTLTDQYRNEIRPSNYGETATHEAAMKFVITGKHSNPVAYEIRPDEKIDRYVFTDVVIEPMVATGKCACVAALVLVWVVGELRD